VRERLAFTPTQLRDALHDVRGLPNVVEAAIIATCNRTEVYVNGADGCLEEVNRYLVSHGTEAVRSHLYSYEDRHAVRHLFRVAAGVDSMVVGEGQILGQVREARRVAAEEQTAGQILRRLFDGAISCGKRVRTETEIGRGAVSVSHVAVDLSRQIFGDLHRKTVLLLGAGETAELTARAFRKFGVSLIMVANRTFERAEALALELNGVAVRFDDFAERLAAADIVVSSTAAPHAVITREIVRSAEARRRGRPVFLIDLAIPRDIEPEVGDLDNVFLYNLDDLQRLVKANIDGRNLEMGAVYDVIEQEVEAFVRWLASLNAVPVLSELQRRFEEIRLEELARTRRRLDGLSPEQMEAVDQMTRAMVRKILHEPWTRLRHTSDDSDAMEKLDALMEAFGLEVPGPEGDASQDAPTRQEVGS
jgi:glutamyl-tRNA reductase